MLKKYFELLGLARESIKSELEGRELIVSESIKKKYSKKLACFVTLTIRTDLRGCIGSIEARQELWKDVVENARNAAFSDPRFDELDKDELNKVKIEISVLTTPKQITYKTEEEMKKKILGKGVILQKGFYSATYLPQVWEDLPEFEAFISSLCQKAGLSRDAWKKLDLKIDIYDAEKVRE
jgi:AmmeMemoRadiSam system protein A